MATTYTSRMKLAKPGPADRAWNVPINANAEAIDAVNAVGAFAVTPKEVPSASLAVSVGAGTYVKADGTTYATFAGAASVAVPASATTLVWLTDAGAVGTGTSWPSPCLRLAVVATDASRVTSVADARTPYRVR